MSRIVAIASTIVRLWTRLYTAGLPPERRDARRLEIESDLWEAAHDPSRGGVRPGGAALYTLARLVVGMADDLAWRHEQERPMRSKQFGAAVLGVACGAIAIWFGVIRGGSVPTPPAPRAILVATAALPPPPPPPPAPTRPGEREPKVTFQYGRASYSALGNAALPRKLEDVAPIYPPIAVMAGVSGTVVLDATIDETGHVDDARIRSSVLMLDQAAVDAVRRWRFEPPTERGAPTRSIIRVVVSFGSKT